MYAVPADLLFHGATELAQLAAVEAGSPVTGELLQLTIDGGDRSAYTAEEQAAADDAVARIEDAIARAGSLIDGYLQPRYTLPLEAALVAGSNLRQAAVDIARWLMTPGKASDELRDRYDRHLRWLRDVSDGRVSLGPADTGVATPSGRVSVRSGASGFDWNSY